MGDGWAERWRNLVAGHDRVALNRGTAYQRSNRVSDLRVTTGGVNGRVQGSRATPHTVQVAVPALPDEAWDEVVEALAGEVRHVARLLAGQVPEGLEGQLRAAGVELFPDPRAIVFDCPCPAPSSRCSHALGVWEAVAVAIGEDPFVLLRLRGRGRERLLAELAETRRARTVAHEPGVRLDALEPVGWTRLRAPIDDLGVPPGHPPPTTAAPLRLLGDPPGWAGGVSAADVFGPLVARADAWVESLTH